MPVHTLKGRAHWRGVRHGITKSAVALAVGGAVLAGSASTALAAWSPAVTLGSGAYSSYPAPKVAGNAAGLAAVVWADSGLVRADLRTAAGKWGAKSTLSAASESGSVPVVAVKPNGDAVAVWASARAQDTVVEAARYVGGAWTAPAVLTPAGVISANAPGVATSCPSSNFTAGTLSCTFLACTC